MRFKIGDRVEFVSTRVVDGNRFLVNGATGTVVHIDDHANHNNIGIAWDEGRRELCPDYLKMFHSCWHHCEDGYGWFVDDRDIAIIEGVKVQEQEIQIEADDLFTLLGGAL